MLGDETSLQSEDGSPESDDHSRYVGDEDSELFILGSSFFALFLVTGQLRTTWPNFKQWKHCLSLATSPQFRAK